MPGLENIRIKKQNEFLQMIFEIIKQTYSGRENEKDLLVLRNFLNIKQNSNSNNLSDTKLLEESNKASDHLLGFHDPAVYEPKYLILLRIY